MFLTQQGFTGFTEVGAACSTQAAGVLQMWLVRG